MESNNRCTENVSLMELENIWFLLLPDIGAQWRPCLIALLSCLERLRPALMLVTRSGHEPQQWLCSHNLQLDRLQSNVHYVFPRKLSLSLYHERFQQHLTWNMFLLVSWFWIFFSWSLIMIGWVYSISLSFCYLSNIFIDVRLFWFTGLMLFYRYLFRSYTEIKKTSLQVVFQIIFIQFKSTSDVIWLGMGILRHWQAKYFM